MEKYSVKKPFTVFVAVIIVVVLGIVSIRDMPTDLLPEMSLPYMIVITPYPGASPEKVEAEVTEMMENALGTVSHVKNINSSSSENYSMTQLEFEDGTDMDSAMVKVSGQIQQISPTLPAGCGTPSIMEISMNMVATMYLAVSRDGYDIFELSDFVENRVKPYLARQDGVASISSIGLVERSIQVDLNAAKIQDLNDRILAKTNKALDDAKKKLDDAKALVSQGQTELEKQEAGFGEMLASGLFGQLGGSADQLRDALKGGINGLIGRLEGLEAQAGSLGDSEITGNITGNVSGALGDIEDAYAEGSHDVSVIGGAIGDARSEISGIAEGISDAIAGTQPGNGAEGQDGGSSAGNGSAGADGAAGNNGSDGSGSAESNNSGAAGNNGSGSAASNNGSAASNNGSAAGDSENIVNADAVESSVNSADNADNNNRMGGINSSDDANSTDAANDSADAANSTSIATNSTAAVDNGVWANGVSGVGYVNDVERTGSADAAEEAAGGETSSAGAETAASEEGGQQDSSFSERQSQVYEALQRTRDRVAAARRLREYVATGDIQNRITNIIHTLREASEVLDGGTFSSLASAISKVVAAGAEVRAIIDGLSQMDLAGELTAPLDNVRAALGTVSGYADQLPALLTMAEGAFSQLTQGQLDAALGFSQAGRQLSDAQTQLETATTQYENARSAALKNANLDALVSASTLSGLIYAQNFSMPAGYIDDGNDNSWLLKIGDEYENYADISESLLADIDDIGTIRLSDVANITVIDNADMSYTRVNGESAIVFSIFKNSATGTNEVSRNVWEAIDQLEEDNEGLHFTKLMDQGEYITMIVGDILKSMGLGALLAIFVLALFLWDIRPTIMVGISIPLSVIFTILLMYFTGLSLNIMTLSGLSLGIGMLVDNSIVVMENIIRLRQRGLTPARASVQGAKQVSGAIIASTLTTVSVFLPMMFTSGTVRELLVPMSLSISYCLVASLIVAMTVIPASASTLFRRVRPKKVGAFDRLLDVYGRFLYNCLKHKLATLAVAVILLVICIIRLVTMGIVVLPDITSDDIEITIVTPEGESREESYKDVEEVVEIIMDIEGVRTVGIMDQGSTVGFFTSAGGDSDTYGTYICYVEPEEDATSSEIRELSERITDATVGLKAKVTVASGGMSDMTALMSSGLSINVKGHDIDMLREIGQKVVSILEPVEGLENVSDGSENDDKALHLVIDKDKAMSYGLTVAQIYSAVSSRMTTDVKSTTITQDGVIMDVTIRDNTNPLTRENVLDIEFDTSGTASSAMSGMGASMGGMGSSSGGGLSSMMGAFSGSSGGSLSSMAEAFMGSSGGASGESGLAALFGTGSSDGPETKEGELVEGAEGGSSDSDSADAASSETEDEGIHKLSEFAYLEETTSPSMINRQNQSHFITVSASTAEGYNTALVSRKIQGQIEELNRSLPNGYSVEIGGEMTEINRMIRDMTLAIILAFLFIYMVMVAQFQSLLSPFIIIFTIPLAFTGGMLGLIAAGEQLSMLSLMGFLILMGTVVNNGIVFVDYANQLRIGGMERLDALVATGKTRMRPILMTAMTTILAMSQLIFGDSMSTQLSRGMAIVIAAGLLYATLMTLIVVPVMYDIFYKKKPMNIELDDDMDDVPDDAAEFMEELRQKRLAEEIKKLEDEGKL